jgi:hypothetical protein
MATHLSAAAASIEASNRRKEGSAFTSKINYPYVIKKIDEGK